MKMDVLNEYTVGSEVVQEAVDPDHKVTTGGTAIRTELVCCRNERNLLLYVTALWEGSSHPEHMGWTSSSLLPFLGVRDMCPGKHFNVGFHCVCLVMREFSGNRDWT